MSTAVVPYTEDEVEDEQLVYEDEWEQGAHEDEDEAEEFFGALASLASRALSNPTLRRVGLGAARAALQAGGRALSDSTGGASNQISGMLQGLLPQSEMEGEDERFVDPFRRVYPNRPLMEHIGHVAAETEDEDEAEALVGSLVPLAARAAPALARATPHLARAMSTVSRQLRASPSTRPLVRALPSILQRTAATVNRQAAAGHRITPTRALHTLARQTARTLGNPRQLVTDYRRSQRLEQRHHARTGQPGIAAQRTYPGWYGGRWRGLAPYQPYHHTHGTAPGYRRHVTHSHPDHPAPHTHAATHPGAPATTVPAVYGPAAPPATSYASPAYGPGVRRRYAPPPGAPAPAPTYAGPGRGAWTCTCQWV